MGYIVLKHEENRKVNGMTNPHIPLKTIETIQPFLQPTEEIIEAKKTGLFGGGDLSILTNLRHLLIGKTISESSYLVEEENIIDYEWQLDSGPVAGWVYVLTNKRFLVVNLPDEKWLVGAYPIENISEIQVCPVVYQSGALTYLKRGFKLQFHDGSHQVFYHTGPIIDDYKKFNYSWRAQGQKDCERFPRKISELTKLPFCPPYMKPGQPKNQLTFYVKSDLMLPWYCCSCMKEESEYSLDKLSLSNSNNNSPIIFGITLEIPYCQSCYQKRFGFLKKIRALKPKSFNGLIASLEFENKNYGDEFVKLNSAPL